MNGKNEGWTSEDEDELPLKNEDGEQAEVGELLMARKILRVQMKEEDSQQENLFHRTVKLKEKFVVLSLMEAIVAMLQALS